MATVFEANSSHQGIINVIKTMTQSVGPLVTGVLASRDLFGVSFITAGVLKIIYDLGILAVFSGHKSQRKVVEEEDEAPTAASHNDAEA